MVKLPTEQQTLEELGRIRQAYVDARWFNGFLTFITIIACVVAYFSIHACIDFSKNIDKAIEERDMLKEILKGKVESDE